MDKELKDPSEEGLAGLDGLKGLNKESGLDWIDQQWEGFDTKSILKGGTERALNKPLQEYAGNQFIGNDFSTSKYDKNISTEYQLDNIDVTREQYQSGLGKFAVGTTKMATTAGLTFLNGTLGLAAGAANVLTGGALQDKDATDNEKELGIFGTLGSRLTHNYVSQGLDDVSEALDRNLVVYKKEIDYQKPWYKRMTSSSIWFDDIAKGIGFSAGAVISGGLVSKGLQGLFKLNNARKVFETYYAAAAKGGNTFGANNVDEFIELLSKGSNKIDDVLLTSELQSAAKILKSAPISIKFGAGIAGAMGEAGIEALSSEKENKERLFKELETAESQFKIKDDVINELLSSGVDLNNMNINEANQLVSQKIQEKNKFLMDNIEKSSLKIGNLTYALNIPIIAGSNVWQFGKYFAGGYSNQALLKSGTKGLLGKLDDVKEIRDATGRLIKTEANKNFIRTATNVGKFISNPITEGVEEMSQGLASETSGMYYNSKLNTFVNMRIDPEAEKETINGWKATSLAAAKYLGNIENWQEFFIGALIGSMGTPTINVSNKRLKVGLAGGIKDDILEYFEKDQKIKEVTSQLNRRLEDPTFVEMYQNMIRRNSLERVKNDALEKQDKFEFKNAEQAQMISDIILFDNLGRVDELRSIIDGFKNLSDTDIIDMVDHYSSTEDGKNNAWKGVENETIKKSITKNSNDYSKILDSYLNIANNIKTIYGNSFDNKVIEEMVWMNVSLKNFNDRRDELRESLNKNITKDFNIIEASDNKEAISLSQIINDSKVFNKVTNDVIKSKLLENGIVNTDDIITSLKDISLLETSIKKFAFRINKFSKSPKLLDDIIKSQDNLIKKSDRLNETSKKVKDIIKEVESSYIVENVANEVGDFSKNIPDLNDINDVSDFDVSKYNQAILDKWAEQLNSGELEWNGTDLDDLASMEPNTNTQYVLAMLSNKGKIAKETYDKVKDYIYSLVNKNPYKDSLISAISKLEGKIYDTDRYSELIDNNIEDIPISVANKIKDLYKSILNNKSLDEVLKADKPVVKNNTNPIDKEDLDGINNKPTTTDRFVEPPEKPPFKILDKTKDLFWRWRQVIYEVDWGKSKKSNGGLKKNFVFQNDGTYKELWDYLNNTGAFEYVNKGKLVKGDTIYFGLSKDFINIDPQWGSQTIFMYKKIYLDENGKEVSPEKSKSVEYQIVGVLGSTFKNGEDFSDITSLRKDIFDEYNKFKITNPNDQFIYAKPTKVSQLLNGAIRVEESGLNNTSNVFTDEEIINSTIGIMQNHRLVIPKRNDITVVRTNLEYNEDGTSYFLRKMPDGRYYPIRLFTKGFNNKEFNINDPVNKENPIYKRIEEVVYKFLKVAPDQDSGTKMSELKYELNKYIHVSHLDMFKTNREITFKFDGKEVNINFVTNREEAVIMTDRTNLETGESLEDKVLKEAIEKTPEDKYPDVVKTIIEALQNNFELSFNISKKFVNDYDNLNKTFNNALLLKSGVIETPLVNNDIFGTYFKIEPITPLSEDNAKKVAETMQETNATDIDIEAKEAIIKKVETAPAIVDEVPKLLDETEEGEALPEVKEETKDESEKKLERQRKKEALKSKLKDRTGKFVRPEVAEGNQNEIGSKTPWTKINLKKELQWLQKVLPQIPNNELVQIHKGLIRLASINKYAWGVVKDGIMIISNMAREGNVYHETMHMLRLFILTDSENEALEKEAIKQFKITDSNKIDEKLSAGFREYQLGISREGFVGSILSFFKRTYYFIKYKLHLNNAIDNVFFNLSNARYAERKLINRDFNELKPEIVNWDKYKKTLKIFSTDEKENRLRVMIKDFGDTIDEMMTFEENYGLSRFEVIKKEGWRTVTDLSRDSFEEAKNRAISENIDGKYNNRIAKLDKVLDEENWEYLVSEFAARLRYEEGLIIDVNKEDVVKELILKDNDEGDDPDLPSVEDGMIDGSESTKERYQDNIAYVSVKSSLSKEILKILRNVYKKDAYGDVDRDDIGMELSADTDEVINELIVILKDITSPDQMLPVLKSKIELKPWLKDVIDLMDFKENDTIEQQRYKDNLQSLFYRQFRLSFKPYWITKIKNNNGINAYETFQINKPQTIRKYINDLQNILDSNSILDRNSVYSEDGSLNIENISNGYEKIKSIVNQLLGYENKYYYLKPDEFEKYSEGYTNIGLSNLEDIVSLVRSVGVETTFDELREVIVKGKSVELNGVYTINSLDTLFENLNVIYSKLLDGKTLSELDGKTQIYNSFKNKYDSILELIMSVRGETIENSVQHDGKSRYSHLPPSFLSKLVTNLKNVFNDSVRYENFLQKEYKNYFLLYDEKTNRYTIDWVNDLVNDKDKRELFDTKILLEFDKTAYEDLSDSDYLLSLIVEYFYDPHKETAWYAIPTQSDADTSEFIKFKRYTGDSYKEVLTEKLIGIFDYEWKRIKEIEYLNTTNNPKIKVFNDTTDFKFLSFLNKDMDKIKILMDNTEDNQQSIEFNNKSYTSISEYLKDAIPYYIDDRFNNVMEDWSKMDLFQPDEKGNYPKITFMTGIHTKIPTEHIREFYWNSFFARSQIIMLTTTDLAYYKDSDDFVKRFKQGHSNGTRLNTKSKDFGRTERRAKFINDAKIKLALDSEMHNVFKKLSKKIGVTQAGNILSNYGISNSISYTIKDSKNKIKRFVQITDGSLNGLKKGYYLVDDKTFVEITKDDFNKNITGIKPKEFYIVNNKKTKSEEDSYIFFSVKEINQTDAQAYISFEHYRNIKGMANQWTPRMQEAYENITRPGGKWTADDLDVVFNVLKPFLYTQTDYTYEKDGKKKSIKVPVNNKNSEFPLLPLEIFKDSPILSAFYEHMDEEGIDLIAFDSTFKVGQYGVNKDNFEELSKEQIIESLNNTVIHTFDMDDYMIQQPIDDHLTDYESLFGTQIRKIIMSNLSEDPNFKITIGGKTMTRREWIDLYNELLTENILQSYIEVSDKFKTVEDLEKLLIDEIRGNKRYSDQLITACSLINGKFVLPLFEPTQRRRVEQLITSIFKNKITKQKIAGGQAVQVTNFGFTNDLKIVYGKDENGRDYIKYFEAYLPWWSKRLISDMIGKDGKLDIDKVPEELRKMIGYRIPTEDKYSMFPIYVKGFSPKAAGNIIMLPAEVTTIAGLDFDKLSMSK